MARRVASRGADSVGKVRKRKSAADKAADELQVLDPTARMTVGGEEIVVREYGFFQKSRVMLRGKAFVDDLRAFVGDAEIEDVWDSVRLLFGPHEAFVKYAIAESTGKPLEWVEALGDEEIEPLTYLWFGVAGRFFFSELTLRARGRVVLTQLDGATSSTPSAATSSALGSTPSAS